MNWDTQLAAKKSLFSFRELTRDRQLHLYCDPTRGWVGIISPCQPWRLLLQAGYQVEVEVSCRVCENVFHWTFKTWSRHAWRSLECSFLTRDLWRWVCLQGVHGAEGVTLPPADSILYHKSWAWLWNFTYQHWWSLAILRSFEDDSVVDFLFAGADEFAFAGIL